MRLKINASSCINPGIFSTEAVITAPPVNACNDFQVPPINYSRHIDARQLRRLSKVAKMGIYTAKACMAQTPGQDAQALIVGTSTGGFSALDSFINNMNEKEEQNLSPVFFLQSLLSDVTGQIVLSMGIKGYTTTYTNRGSAFESSLLDAQLLLEENPDQTVLVGGTDELPQVYGDIVRHSGFLEPEEQMTGPSSISLGENAIFFSLSKASDRDKVYIVDCGTYLGLDKKNINQQLEAFLQENGHLTTDIDLVLSGFYNQDQFEAFFPEGNLKKNVVFFKQYCGEFSTSTAFGVWLAEQLLSAKISPEALELPTPFELKNILVINQFRASNFSFTLLSSNQ
ncbi:MAG: beta-ketoacyl synthase chain length factor [Saprospiraceae bacterium]